MVNAIITNSSFVPLQGTSPQAQTTSKISSSKITDRISFYNGTSWANVPSDWNIVFAPWDYCNMTAALERAEEMGDQESLRDINLRMVGTPFSFVNGCFSVFSNPALSIPTQGINPLLLMVLKVIGCAFGLPLCAVEMLFETNRIRRALRLSNKVDTKNPIKSLQSIQKRFLEVSAADKEKIKLTVLKRFPKLTPSQHSSKVRKLFESVRLVKLGELASRVRPWLAKEIYSTLPSILAGLKRSDPKALEKAQALMQKIDSQTRKVIFTHVFALISLGLAVGVLIGTLAGIPLAVLLIPSILSMVTCFGKSASTYWLLDHPGWSLRRH